MTSAQFSFHTVLARKLRTTSSVELVIGHPSIISKTADFQNGMFTTFETGTFVEVKFRMSGDKRYVVGCKSVSNPEFNSQTDVLLKVRIWLSQTASSLIRERDSFLKSHASSLFSASRSLLEYVVLPGKNFSHYGDRMKVKIFVKDDGVELRSDDSSFTHSTNVASTVTEYEVPMRKQPSIFSDTRLSLSALGSVSEKAGMFVRRGDWALYEAAKSIAADGASNILMVGPSGSGKTSIPVAFAQEHGMNVFKMDCATVRDPEEWFGHREAVAGTTVFVRSPFVQALEAGNTLIILDEFNRVEPWLHNSLYALLDHTRRTQIHGEEVKVAKGTIFVATTNIGSSFTGTFVLDAALTNRFDAVVFTNFLDKKSEVKLLIERVKLDEESSVVVVDIMDKLRNIQKNGVEIPADISTRTSLKIAQLIMHSNLPLKKILDYAILSLIDDSGTSKIVMDAIAPLCSPSL